jgi:hypothetical protein
MLFSPFAGLSRSHPLQTGSRSVLEVRPQLEGLTLTRVAMSRNHLSVSLPRALWTTLSVATARRSRTSGNQTSIAILLPGWLSKRTARWS